MSRVFQVLLVLALVGGVLGYFRNWYAVSRLQEGPSLDAQHINILIRINRQRIQEDLRRAATRVRALADRNLPAPAPPPASDPSGYSPYDSR